MHMEFTLIHLLFFSLLPLVFVITIFSLKWFSRTVGIIMLSPKRLPPCPPSLPIFGNIHQVGLLPHRSFQSLSKKYGSLMMLSFASKAVVVASSPDAAREILKNQDLVFSNRPKSRVAEKILHGSLDVGSAPYGECWRQLKSICTLHLLSNKRVQSFHHIRDEETSQMIQKIKQKCSSSPSSSSSSWILINLSEMLLTATTDVVTRVTIGKRCSDGLEDSGKIVGMMERFIDVLGSFNIADHIPWLSWVNRFINGLDAKVEKVREEIDEIFDAVIEQHRLRKKGCGPNNIDSGKPRRTTMEDFVDILLDIQQGNFTSFPFEQGIIKALILDMISAGTHTTATLMDWVMVELLRHPKIMEKLQTEIRQAVNRGKPQVTEDDLPRMPYLKAVIKETSRLHCPVPLLLPHESSQDVKVMGYDISAGTQVIVNAWAIGRDQNIWEKPEEFIPERFLNSNIDFRGFHFELIPFGAGRRSCPGISFAVAVSELVTARLLHNFNFALPTGVKPEEMDMTEKSGINGKRKLPLFVHVSPNSFIQ